MTKNKLPHHLLVHLLYHANSCLMLKWIWHTPYHCLCVAMTLAWSVSATALVLASTAVATMLAFRSISSCPVLPAPLLVFYSNQFITAARSRCCETLGAIRLFENKTWHDGVSLPFWEAWSYSSFLSVQSEEYCCLCSAFPINSNEQVIPPPISFKYYCLLPCMHTR